MKALSTLAGNFARGGPFVAINPILGGVDDDGHHVYSIDPAGGVMKDDYTVTAPGSPSRRDPRRPLRGRHDQRGGTGADAAGSTRRRERDTGSEGIYLADVTADGVDINGYDFDELLYGTRHTREYVSSPTRTCR